MAFAGGLGMELALSLINTTANLTDPAVLLFSESTTRFLLEIEPGSTARFEAAICRSAAIEGWRTRHRRPIALKRCRSMENRS